MNTRARSIGVASGEPGSGNVPLRVATVGLISMLWLAPEPAAAQYGCDTNANYGPWGVDWCPSVTNSPGLNPDRLCGAVGQTPPTPGVTLPIYAPGHESRLVSFQCAPTNNYYQERSVTYSVSGPVWDPVLPTVFAPSNAPYFYSAAYAVVSGGDALCPPPGRCYIGTATWFVAMNSTNCPVPGSVTLTNGVITTNVCIRSAVNASVSQIRSNGQVVVTTPACPYTTNADTYVTNTPAPTIVSNWWVVSGPGSYTASGGGLSASFTPTTGGSGTVTLNLTYEDDSSCFGTNIQNATPVSLSFNVIQITNQCVATTPTDQARTTVGVCEDVNVSVVGNPSCPITWTLSGGGVINPTNGTSTTFSAPDAQSTCIVTANFTGGACNQTFGVAPPSGVRFVKLGEKHTQGQLDAGFHAQCIILDTSVSFYNIEISEMHATYTGDGCFAWVNGQVHPTWTEQGPGWLTPGQNNYLSTGVDYTYICARPAAGPGPGTASCPIPWNYRKHGATNDGYNFATLTSSASATTNVCTKSKNGMSSTPFNISDPTVSY